MIKNNKHHSNSLVNLLDKNQRHAINLYDAGFNLFITGSAGTGKSLLIKSMKESYIKKYKTSKGLYITSTTGLSSINIEGITIHSWSGITPVISTNDVDTFVNIIHKNYKIYNKYLYTKVLIIDEISMLSYKFLDFLNKVLQVIRKNSEAFGGIQIVLVGDYYQLPPVNKFNDDELFSFKAHCWDKIIDYSIILKTIHRQNDTELILFLNKIRKGVFDGSVLQMLETFSNNENYNPNYTHLYPNKLHVNAYNLQRLYSIEGEIITNNARMIYKTKIEYAFPKDTIIVETLLLKKGAFVIINKNIDQDNNLVNGTQGIFKGFNQFKHAIIETSDGRIHYINKQRWEYPSYFIEQYPLSLAWALTIHKSQGMGIKYLSVDVGDRIFSDGQMYVALSRATDPKYLHIKNFSKRSIRSNKTVKKFYNNLLKKGKVWYKTIINSEEVYQNKLNGKIRKKIPKGAKLEELSNTGAGENEDDELHYPGIFHKNANKDFMCKICRLNEIEQSYSSLFDERVCMECIIKKDYYQLLNKKDIKDIFNLNSSEIKEATHRCMFKSQENFFNPRFLPTRLYLKGHIEENINKNKYSLNNDDNNSKINKYFRMEKNTPSMKVKSEDNQSIHNKKIQLVENNTSNAHSVSNAFEQYKNMEDSKIEEKTITQIPKLTIKDRMRITFQMYFNENKSFTDIAEALGNKYKKRTIENYIYKCFIVDEYDFSSQNLEYIGFDDNLLTVLTKIVDEWREKEKTPELYPRLRYIKDNIDNRYSYILIKMGLYKIYNYIM